MRWSVSDSYAIGVVLYRARSRGRVVARRPVQTRSGDFTHQGEHRRIAGAQPRALWCPGVRGRRHGVKSAKLTDKEVVFEVAASAADNASPQPAAFDGCQAITRPAPMALPMHSWSASPDA